MDARERPAAARPAVVLSLLRRQFQGGVPHWIGPLDESLRCSEGDNQPADPALPARRVRAPPSLWRESKISDRPSLEGLPVILRVLSWGERRGPRGKPPNRLDWIDRKNDRVFRPD